MEWLEQQTFFFHSLEAVRSKIKAAADTVSAESSPPGLQTAPFSLLFYPLPAATVYQSYCAILYLSICEECCSDILWLPHPFMFSHD